MAGVAGGKTLWITIIFALLVIAGLVFILHEPNVNAEGSPREDRIAEFREEMELAEGQRLVWSPHLLSETFTVGTVFPAEGMGQAVTTACKSGAATISTLTVRLGDGKRYAIKPEMDLGEGVALTLNGAKAVEYALTIEEAEVLPAYSDMVRSLASVPECLAIIANQPVMVLYGVFRGDESYKLSRTIGGNLTAGKLAELAGAKLGLGGEGRDTSDFARQDVALLWSLTRVHLIDERFPVAETEEQVEAISAFRLAKAEQLLREEVNYASRADNRVEITAPSAEETAAMLDALIAGAAQ